MVARPSLYVGCFGMVGLRDSLNRLDIAAIPDAWGCGFAHWPTKSALNAYAHEQLCKVADRLLHTSIWADGLEGILEYPTRIWFLCARFAQIKAVFAETCAIGAHVFGACLSR